jgi:hypothetical protein
VFHFHDRLALLPELSIGLPPIMIRLGVPFALSDQFVVAGQFALVHGAANRTAGLMSVSAIRSAKKVNQRLLFILFSSYV